MSQTTLISYRLPPSEYKTQPDALCPPMETFQAEILSKFKCLQRTRSSSQVAGKWPCVHPAGRIQWEQGENTRENEKINPYIIPTILQHSRKSSLTSVAVLLSCHSGNEEKAPHKESAKEMLEEAGITKHNNRKQSF